MMRLMSLPIDCYSFGMNSTLMMPPALLKQFAADLEIVQAALASGLAYLDAETRFAQAGDELRRRWMDAKDCGAALQRIHNSKSYEDEHKDWSAFCRALKPAISRQHVYRLMQCAAILSDFPSALIGRIEMPLSFRLVSELSEIDEDIRKAITVESATDEDAAFERLTETLKTMRDMKAAAPAVKQPKSIEWARKHTSAIERLIHELGGDELGLPLVRALDSYLEKLLVRQAA
jgi:hypothetical protein